MVRIGVSKDDYAAIALAAGAAQDDGEVGLARSLDKIARKIDAAITNQSNRIAGQYLKYRRPLVRWQDMPSTLEPRP